MECKKDSLERIDTVLEDLKAMDEKIIILLDKGMTEGELIKGMLERLEEMISKFDNEF